MSLEASINTLNATIQELIAVLKPEALVAPTQAPIAQAPAPVNPAPTPAAPEPAPAAPAAEAPAVVTYDAVKAAILKVVSTKGNEAAAQVLAKFGVTKGPSLKPEQYVDVIAACEAA